jgi:hypothetical protein
MHPKLSSNTDLHNQHCHSCQRKKCFFSGTIKFLFRHFFFRSLQSKSLPTWRQNLEQFLRSHRNPKPGIFSMKYSKPTLSANRIEVDAPKNHRRGAIKLKGRKFDHHQVRVAPNPNEFTHCRTSTSFLDIFFTFQGKSPGVQMILPMTNT